ncbi:MAG: hypothetical protein RSD26_10340 [Cellulosilyticaceae bacterium]
METKIIEFSMTTVWDWLIQLIALGLLGIIIAISIAVLILLIRKLKKKS